MRAALSIPSATGEAAGLAQMARVKGLAALGRGAPSAIAEHIGASSRVTKAVGAMSTSDSETLVDRRIIVSAFIQQLRNASAFFALLDRGMTRVDFQTRISQVVADATAWIVGEGLPVPLSRTTLESVRLEGRKAAALIVLTEELLRNTQSEAGLTRSLRRAIAAAVDGEFFSIAIDSGTAEFASSGNDATSAVEDIRKLLNAVAPTVESSLMFAADPAVVRAAATLTNASGAFQFPDLTPTGGEILGIPVVPTDAIGSGKMALFDATGFAGQSGDIAVEASAEAAIEMLADGLLQNATTGAATELVSMFQTNSVAIRATADFDALRLRDDAVAILGDIEWTLPASSI